MSFISPGSGLGKDEGGIKEAIKVDLKMDRAGVCLSDCS